jgi:toxin ParE1/3/4
VRKGYVVLPSADADLDEQADYLAENANADTAFRFYDAAEKTFAFLASTPEAGAPWEAKDAPVPGLRLWRIKGFEKLRVFYRTTEDGIDIVRVIHTSRDIEAAFGGSSGGCDC